jgi:hypothetical protein
LLCLLVAMGGALWFFGPTLVSPVEDFAQGPGAAVAYISLARQMAEQAPEFWEGHDVKLLVKEDEFSGMLSSALLSGRQAGNPVQRVRSSLERNRLQVETILSLQDPRIPAQFQSIPVGVRLWLRPTVTDSGQIEFAITRAALGQIPVPAAAIRWAGRHLPVSTPGFDAPQATITLPVSQMVTAQFGRNVQLKQFRVTDADLELVLAMTRSKN